MIFLPSGVHIKPKPKTNPIPKLSCSFRVRVRVRVRVGVRVSFWLSGVLRWAKISLAHFSGRTSCYLVGTLRYPDFGVWVGRHVFLYFLW